MATVLDPHAAPSQTSSHTSALHVSTPTAIRSDVGSDARSIHRTFPEAPPGADIAKEFDHEPLQIFQLSEDDPLPQATMASPLCCSKATSMSVRSSDVPVESTTLFPHADPSHTSA